MLSTQGYSRSDGFEANNGTEGLFIIETEPLTAATGRDPISFSTALLHLCLSGFKLASSTEVGSGCSVESSVRLWLYIPVRFS